MLAWAGRHWGLTLGEKRFDRPVVVGGPAGWNRGWKMLAGRALDWPPG